MPLKIQDGGSKNQINIDETVVGNATVSIRGSNNVVVIGVGSVIKGPLLEILGNDCAIIIGGSCKLGAMIRCRADKSKISIGTSSTMLGATITCHEAGSIEIGMDCMFSGDVRMDVSDMHPIIDRATKERINAPKSIIIGDHVWLSHGVTVAKGCRIGSGSVIGAKSLARGNIPSNVIAAGVPTKVLRENIEWERKFS